MYVHKISTFSFFRTFQVNIKITENINNSFMGYCCCSYMYSCDIKFLFQKHPDIKI